MGEFEIIKTEFIPGFDSNTVLITNGLGDAALVDPNGKPEIISNKLKGQNLRAIYLTHGHHDHISAAHAFGKIPIYMSKLDIPVVKVFSNQVLGMAGFPPLDADSTIDLPPGEIEFLPGLKCKVMRFPGHSPGMNCFYFENEKIFLSGDFVFKGAIGRTDIYLGDSADMKKSLEEFMNMNWCSKDVKIIPGHGGIFKSGKICGNVCDLID